MFNFSTNILTKFSQYQYPKQGILVLFFLLLFWQPETAHAQKFTAFSQQEGLNEGSIQCVAKDSAHLFWIGTYDGINLFDGFHLYDFEKVFHQSLPNKSITNIVFDSIGNAYIGTAKQLLFFDRANQQLQTLVENGNAYPIEIFRNHLVVYDAQQGFYKMSLDKKRTVETINSELKIKYIYYHNTTVQAIGEKMFTLLNNTTIAEINLTSKQTKLHKIPNDAGSAALSIQRVFVKKNGDFVLGTEGGLYLFSNGKLQKEESISAHIHSSFFALTSINDSVFWIGTENDGLFQYNFTSRLFQHYKNTEDAATNDLLSNYASFIHIIHPGLILVNCEPYGFMKIDLSEKLTIKKTSSNIGSIKAFLKDNKQQIWAGTQDNGLILLDSTYQIRKKFCSSNSTLSSNTIQYLQNIFTDYLLVATPQGLYYKTTDSQTPLVPVYSPIEKKQTTFNVVIRWRNEEALVLSENYVYRLDKHFVLHPLMACASYYIDMHLLNDSMLLLSKIDNGADVVRLNKDSNYIAKRILKNYFINHVEQHFTDSLYYFYTDKGLLITTRSFEIKATIHSTNSALVNNFLYCGMNDKKGNIWISSNNGIAIYNPTLKTVRYPIEPKDLQSLEFNANAFLKQAEDTFLFGGSKGINAIFPERLKPNRCVPIPYFRSLSINDKERISIFSPHLQDQVFSYGQNTVSVQFAVIDFCSNGKNYYQYKLEGIDPNWVNAGSENAVRYAQLPPGNYTFKVKVANSDMQWNETPAAFNIEIQPPYYMTWWFYTLCAFSTIGIVGGMYRYQLNQKIKEYKIRDTIAADLHDDVGATLTNINLLSQVVKRSLPKENSSYTYLDQIHKSSRDSMENMSDIVWSVNPKNDHLELLIEKIKHIGESLFVPVDVEFKITASQEITALKINMPARKNIYLTLKEALINITKHAYATKVTVQLIKLNHYLQIEVTDNGTGIDVQKESTGNGIANMKKRVEEIGGTLTIKSDTDIGTSILIVVPIKKILI